MILRYDAGIWTSVLFHRFEEISRDANPLSDVGSRKSSFNRLFPVLPISGDDDFQLHDYEKELLPKINPSDLEIYEDYLHRGLTLECKQSNQDLEAYLSYVKVAKGLWNVCIFILFLLF